MRRVRSKPRRKSRVRRLVPELEEAERSSASSSGRERGPERGQTSAYYAAGPALDLGNTAEQRSRRLPGADQRGAAEEEAEKESTVPATHGKGVPSHQSVKSNGRTLRLEGRTDAEYDGGTYRTVNTRVRPATDCESCDDDCIHVTGTLVARYRVSTRVTLPRVSDYPDLTPCQRARVRHAIRNVLAPHEQQHVQAFQQYNGTTRTRFDITLCRSAFESRIHSMFEAEEQQRRASAQAASDALDPFHFDVDLECED